MATVELREDTFEALKSIASRDGSDIAAMVEIALMAFIAGRAMTNEEYGAAWDRLRSDIQAHMPPDITDEEIERDIDAAIAEVRAERLARELAVPTFR